jgi:hypothetical protein
MQVPRGHPAQQQYSNGTAHGQVTVLFPRGPDKRAPVSTDTNMDGPLPGGHPSRQQYPIAEAREVDFGDAHELLCGAGRAGDGLVLDEGVEDGLLVVGVVGNEANGIRLRGHGFFEDAHVMVYGGAPRPILHQ